MARLSAAHNQQPGYPPSALQRRLPQVVIYLTLIGFCIIAIYPMLMMILNSFKSNQEILVNPAGLPRVWTLSSYQEIFSNHTGLWQNYLISLTVAGITTVGSVFLSALAAFSFAKLNFRGKNLIFAALLATMMVPLELNIPGLYILFAELGLLNTIGALILPKLTPIIGLFMIRQYMLTIPDALIESARIDGAGYLTIFWRIMLPVSAPILGACAILQFITSWNDYLWPSIVILRQDLQPLMIVLPRLTDETGFQKVWGTIMAGSTLATIPIMLVFIRYQEAFMSSMTVGSVKE
jgi:ABC-type glycerol-3-phosphate transport system permease component